MNVNRTDTTMNKSELTGFQPIRDDSVVTDDLPIELYHRSIDPDTLPFMSYAKILPHNTVSQSESSSNETIYRYGAEFIYILIIAVILINIIKVHKEGLSRLLSSLFSQYMIGRMVSTSSYRVSNLIIKNNLILPFLIGVIIEQGVIKNGIESPYHKMTFMIGASLISFVIISLNIIVQELFIRFSHGSRGAFSKVILFDRWMVVLYNSALLCVAILYFSTTPQWASITNMIATSLFGVVIIYHLITLSKLFYNENLSFLQYILYLCSTKLIYIALVSILIYKMLL